MSKYNTLFGQMLSLIPRSEFQKSVNRLKTERHARGFSSWNHFTALLFGQLGGQNSLRSIESGLAVKEKSLYHLGVASTKRSTLSYANQHRNSDLFRDMFFLMVEKCRHLMPGHRMKFKNPLYSIDSTTISLCLSVFDWAKSRKKKAAVKLHVKHNHNGYLPSFVTITNGKVHDQTAARGFEFSAGDVVVFDRGYCDFKWLKSLDNQQVFFVTRQRANADYCVVERKDVSDLKNISSDQIIKIRGPRTRKDYPGMLRRIRSIDPKTGKAIVILTNNFKWSASTISKIYKDRWQIELFFKFIKGNLKIKSFLGTSENAVCSQLWVALTAYLILWYMKMKSACKWSMTIMRSILPANLFERVSLWDWLGNKNTSQLAIKATSQLGFDFG